MVDATAIDALDRQAQVSLYRIAQEATTNAVKHAGGSRIDVIARTLEKGGIELCVADNGRGAHEEELQRGGMHRGVDAMRERAWGVGGTMTFEETTGGGCTVRVIVPPRPAVDGQTRRAGPATRCLTQASAAAGAGARPASTRTPRRRPPG